MVAHMSDWYNDCVFYEIYLRSFQDSDGDGIGDLKGITNRLDYFQDLGIDAIWITPFFESPQVDFGYDISNHKAIDPQYGTMADFEELIAEAKTRNIKVIVDIILNHTSDEHPLFLESRSSRQSPKRDWYIWKDAKADGSPPNNWEGFEHSSWTFDDKTQQYYYHFHYPQQPDLNWRNPKVVEEMFSICDFWLDKGATALRLDAINYLVEDPDFRDNPIVGETPSHLRNIFQFDQDPIHNINHPENHVLLKQLRKHVQDNHDGDPLLIGEIWIPTVNDLLQYYGDNGNELQLPFNFFLSAIPELTATSVRECVDRFDRTLGDLPTTVLLSNHDFPRSTTRYFAAEHSDQAAKLMATLLLTLRGIPFIYYGEELGLRDVPPQTLEEVKDPRGRLRWPDYKGRDGCRRPMPWSSASQGGFTTGEPWLKLGPDYPQNNVESQKAEADSVFNHYKAAIALRRRTPALRRGKLTLLGTDPNVLAYLREYEGEAVAIALNIDPNPRSYSLELPAHLQGKSLKPVFSNYPIKQTPQTGTEISLSPFEAVVITLDARS